MKIDDDDMTPFVGLFLARQSEMRDEEGMRGRGRTAKCKGAKLELLNSLFERCGWNKSYDTTAAMATKKIAALDNFIVLHTHISRSAL